MSSKCDVCKKTPGEYWAEMKNERLKAFHHLGTDGPLIRLLKAILGFRAFHGPVEFFVKAWLGHKNMTDIEMGNEPAKSEFNKYIEWYWITWTSVLVCVYFVSLWACNLGSPYDERSRPRVVGCVVLILLASVVSIFRILEILAVSFRLHLLIPYKTNAPPHAMVLTFLAYVHALIGFAVLYLAESYLFGDRFKSCPGLWASPVDAMYFSAVTITTVGYGDLSPEVWLGKLVIILEIFVGLILVVVAFQRVLGGFEPPADVDCECPRSQSPPDSATQTDS